MGYTKYKLLLTQGNDTVEVVLGQATAAVFRDVVSWWGKFSSSEGNIPLENKAWLYAQGKWELTLMNSGGSGVGMGGGGLGYGELASLPPAATLSRALMTGRGVKPSDSSGIGSGEVLNASEISVRFHPGRMTWQLLGFQIAGSSVWNSP